MNGPLQCHAMNYKNASLLSTLLLLLLACRTSSSDPAPGRFAEETLREIDRTIEGAIAERRLPGAVFRVEHGGESYIRAYGNRALLPAIEPMSDDTIFDAASLTKVVATSPSIWILIERGRIGIDDEVSKYIPELTGGGKEQITVRHLLTHTSGLRPGLPLSKPWSGSDAAIRLASEEIPVNKPGFVFRYSDVNFILLGEVVKRVTGEPIDVFSSHEVFRPLRMVDTGFRPSPTLRSRIAPTELVEGEILRGVVHDPTARRMGGVAGHAGLFLTSADLARYIRMILNGGTLNGVRIFRPETVAAMTSVQSPPNVSVRRAGGWDIDSSYSRPRGGFPLGSFGHTGWTGNFIWIEPRSKTFYTFLSNRVHPDGKGNILALYGTIGKLVPQLRPDIEWSQLASIPERIGGHVHVPVAGGEGVQNGIDVVVAQRYGPLRGLRVGLITNHTGIDKDGNPTIDLLRSAPGVELVALFSPEHGIRGKLDENVSDETDPVSGIPIYSLYGERRKPSAAQLRGIDVLVFDVQDVGARFYTYISTMGLAMEAAGEAGIKFMVLDRVNPITGSMVEGPLLEGDTTFIGWHPIVIRHGMTVGELAHMFREERKMNVDLTVVHLQGWSRALWHDQTSLPWIGTSPNMRTLEQATLYPGVALLEFTDVSVGRWTAMPFEVLGAPWMNGPRVAAELEGMNLPGIDFQATEFTPAGNKFKGERCSGIGFTVSDRNAFRPVITGIAIAQTIDRIHPGRLDRVKLNRLLRHSPTIAAIERQAPLSEIAALWESGLAEFIARRSRFLLY